MDLETTLFHLESENISIDIVARFENEILVIDGYDIGKTVKEYWGDSDYEYCMRIPPAGINQLFTHFSIPSGEKKALLETLAEKYNTNTCYSQLEELTRQLNIQHESFKWT